MCFLYNAIPIPVLTQAALGRRATSATDASDQHSIQAPTTAAHIQSIGHQPMREQARSNNLSLKLNIYNHEKSTIIPVRWPSDDATILINGH